MKGATMTSTNEVVPALLTQPGTCPEPQGGPEMPDATRVPDHGSARPTVRDAQPGEKCSCGNPAVKTVLTEKFGPVGMCESSAWGVR